MSGLPPRALFVTGVAIIVSLAVDVAVGYSSFPGYGASLGLGGCIAIIVISKWIGKTFLDRPEDYYPDDAPPDLQPDVLPPEHPEADRAPVDADPAGRLDPTSGSDGVHG
jgi:hypothetical protein